MMLLTRRYWVWGLCAVFWGVGSLAACSGTPENQVQTDTLNPDITLKPGLSLLVPYDFKDKTVRGLRWLDNYVLNQPRSSSGHRARYWLLRTRLDWLTLAYLEDDVASRVALLSGLMDHLGIAHNNQGIDNDQLFELVTALEGHAEGVAQIPEYARVGQGALLLLQSFRNLDLSPGYFEGLGGLRQEMVKGQLPEPFSAGVFAPNALLMASAELMSRLGDLDSYGPDRQPHVLALIAAYPCPKGLVAFGKASLESREEPLFAGCGWPCPNLKEIASADRSSVVAACGDTLRSGDPLFSISNEVMLRLLDDLAQLSTQNQTLVTHKDAVRAFPVLAEGKRQLEALNHQVSGRVFVLDLPEYHGTLGQQGVQLMEARYTRPPEISPVIVLFREGAFDVMFQPTASLTAGEINVDSGIEPDKRHVDQALEAYGTKNWPAQRTVLSSKIDDAVATFAKRFRLNVDAIGAANMIPKLVLDLKSDTRDLEALIDTMHHRGHPVIDLVVRDTTLNRSGLIRVSLGKKSPPAALVVRFEKDAIRIADPSVKKPRILKHNNGEPDLTELYMVLMRQALGTPQNQLPLVALEFGQSARLSDILGALDLLRFWRKVEEGTVGKEIQNAEPQAINKLPKVLVKRFMVVVPTAKP